MKRFKSSRHAVTVIEVLFATGIAIFGLIGIASLISVAGRQASQSNAATISQSLANQWFGEFIIRDFNRSPNWRQFDDSTSGGTLAARFSTVSGTTRQTVCIDPLFYADPLNETELLKAYPTTQAYRPRFFPYYAQNLNPLSDPFSPTFSGDRPRFLRVGLSDPSVRRLFSSFDDQVVLVANVDDPTTTVDERDPSAAATRRLDSNGNQFVANGEYSWFATLCPRELLPMESTTAKVENLYTLSLVVLKRRDRMFFKPSASGAESVPEGERIANVTSTINFQGGSGGRVTLSGSLNVGNKLLTGDWVMLSRFQSASNTIVARWFRVIGLDAKPTEDKAAGTWTRSVSLDGPDWVFDAAFPTQATLVSNVVTVFERVVEVKH